MANLGLFNVQSQTKYCICPGKSIWYAPKIFFCVGNNLVITYILNYKMDA